MKKNIKTELKLKKYCIMHYRLIKSLSYHMTYILRFKCFNILILYPLILLERYKCKESQISFLIML